MAEPQEVALMCGIAGIFGFQRQQKIDVDLVQRMNDSIVHRGPDGEGMRVGSGYILAHRRLAIVDVKGGAQPMALPDERLWLTFNGEIYNYLELRDELAATGVTFCTNSDTEVLLHGYRAWGTGLAAKLRGMFAFVIVDEEKHELYAARDRVGKKPFYWCEHESQFAFGSELKVLRQMPRRWQLRADSVAQFLALRYVPDPNTVFEGAHKLPPAHWLHIKDGRIQQQRYWQLQFEPDQNTREWHQEEVLRQLDDAVKVRLMGEVPLAPFLSGGVDSYAVVDSMIRTTGRPVEACTIGFSDPAFDEREGARESAKACGAALREELLDVDTLLDLDWFAETYDEPFSDSSAIPTYHVSRLARRHVTVALSGDGGDEGFGGYRRYLFDCRENSMRKRLPRSMWRILGALYPKADWLPRHLRAKRTLQNLALDPAIAYARSVSAHLPEESLAVLRREHHAAAGDPHQPLLDAYRASTATSALHRAVTTDLATWLPGDILVKADRASMAVSLEVRAPFLDHHMLEAAGRIPPDWHFEGGRTKAFLRDTLAKRLTPSALTRKKMGFSVPLRAWCQGPIGDAVEGVLSERKLGEWIDPEVVRTLLNRHRQGSGDHSEMLWAVLVLARFLERWGADACT
ncbi:MAG: asparagine synthase (glutamine-hydrolyzing) [Planctomycetota bacterium]